MTELYGESNFGRGCLLARRLIENKVRYVEVTRGGWDTHDSNFVAWLLIVRILMIRRITFDLEIRGLLNETLVVLTSEFGRTPKLIQEMVEIIGQKLSLLCWWSSKAAQYMVRATIRVWKLRKTL